MSWNRNASQAKRLRKKAFAREKAYLDLQALEVGAGMKRSIGIPYAGKRLQHNVPTQ